jgi:DNA-binding NtrC family response regulator
MAKSEQVETTTMPAGQRPAPASPGGATPHASLIVDHLESTRVVRLVEGHPVVVGRDPSAEVAIGDTSVSRRHARFELKGGAVTVTDLRSTNGTKVNGTAVREGVVNLGDEVTLGNVCVTLFAPAPLRASRGGPLSHDQFVAALEEEVERARTFHRTVAVAMLAQPDDPRGLEQALRARLRSVDRLALYGDGTLELVLPEMDADEVRRLLSSLPQARGGVASFPDDGVSAEALLEASREALRRATPGQPVQRSGLKPSTLAPSELIFVSPVMRSIFETVGRVANAAIPVLIRGETGTGKEVLARAIHDQSRRGKHRLVAINCGAIPATLVESVLFGHERGAFTGATNASPGVFEEGDGSTVLLDEVGELSGSSQAALLRVLETQQVRRVGASREVTVDVRVIAATHRDLDELVRLGTFREDLLYRLNAMTLEVPPLRERPEEIGPFAERFLALANTANGRQLKGIEPEAMRVLLRYPWPGNIRELRNAIDHAVVVASGTHIQAHDLPRKTREFVSTMLKGEESSESSASLAVGDLRESVQRYETQVILEALRAAQGKRTVAARRLQIPVRTLSHKLRQYGITKLGFGVVDDSDDA